MRARSMFVLCACACGAGGVLAACFDLFHSTSSIRTACQIDAAACQPLCATSSEEARRRAQQACAWLGACETPLGRNAFGPCMFEAMLAYDCASNPNHRFRGAAADFWECLASAQDCAAVDACLLGPLPRGCERDAGNYLSCADDSVRVECNDRGIHAESCAGWGQSCATTATGAVCAESTSESCPPQGYGCYGHAIHYCGDDGGIDLGVDCADFGSGRCDGFPDRDAAAWVACIAQIAQEDKGSPDGGDAGPPTCEPSDVATCDGGIAWSCASGIPESLNCAALFDSADACVPGPWKPAFDWTSPCALSPAECTGDSCDGGALTGCFRGAPWSVDCHEAGLGGCQMVTTDNGSQLGAACSLFDGGETGAGGEAGATIGSAQDEASSDP
jgi:hypothetical protein